MLRTAYLLTRDHALVEDLLQKELARAWSAWSLVSGDPEPYPRTIMTRTYCSCVWRRRWRGEVPSVELPEQRPVGSRTASGPALDAVEERTQLWSASGRLPRRQRAVVVLRCYEDMSEPQTADALGCAVGTVKSQLAKALARLQIDPSLADDTTGEPARGLRRRAARRLR